MNDIESIEFLENLEKGKFCTIGFPLTNNISLNITAMYVGKQNDEIYNFFDNGGVTGIFRCI